MAASGPRAAARLVSRRTSTASAVPGPRRLAAAVIAGVLGAALLVGCGQVPGDTDSTLGRADRPAPPATSAPTSAAPNPSADRTTPPPKPTAPSDRPSAAAVQPKKGTTHSTVKPSATAAVTQRTILVPGDTGGRVRELQARLQQLDWFSGKITEHYGAATAAAVKGFQHKRGLPSTGELDETTWARLVAMTRQPTHDELHNVPPAGPAILTTGDTGDQVKELQARLTQLDWFAENITGYYGDVTAAAVRGFQDKRGLPTTGAVDRQTWNRLVGMTHRPTPTELSGTGATTPVPAKSLDPRCLTGRAMCIDKTTDQLVWVIDGKPQMRFDVRFGADTSPTREGSFNVGWKARDWVSTIYHSSMPYSMFFSGGQAVHYSSDFAARGYAGASHGCVNVRDLDGLRTLFDQVRVGDKVIVYRS